MVWCGTVYLTRLLLTDIWVIYRLLTAVNTSVCWMYVFMSLRCTPRTGISVLCSLCSAAQLCWLCATPWTAAHQAPLSMEFSRQEYWSELPFPPPGDLPNPGIEPESLESSCTGRWIIYQVDYSATRKALFHSVVRVWLHKVSNCFPERLHHFTFQSLIWQAHALYLCNTWNYRSFWLQELWWVCSCMSLWF